MTKRAVLLVLTLLLVAGCSSNSDDGDAVSTTSSASDSAQDSATSVTAMSIPEVSSPASAEADSDTVDSESGTILMLKLQVGDIDEAEDFYGTVFGASLAYDLGEQARVMTFPDGPGLILLEGDAAGDDGSGSFVMQVADLEETQALAIENGATSAESFEGTPGGEQAQSVRLYDPWGNGVEILQLG